MSRKKAQSQKQNIADVSPLPLSKPCKIIGIYNFKGGVGKTTNTINLSAALAKAGKRTVVIDADPQCNLTSFFMPPDEIASAKAVDEADAADDDDAHDGDDMDGGHIAHYTIPPKAVEAVEIDFLMAQKERFYMSDILDIYHLVIDAYTGEMSSEEMIPRKMLNLEGVENLFLIPGNPLLTQLENNLNLVEAQPDTASVYLGAFRKVFKAAAEVAEADYVLIDMGPSMSSLNKTMLMSCDFILPPVFPDFFSVSSISTLVKDMIPFMMTSHERIMEAESRRLSIVQKALGYGFNPNFPKILPFLVTNFSFRKQAVNTKAAGWIITMQELLNSKVFASDKVQAQFVRSDGQMVIPFAPSFGSLYTIAMKWGMPPVLMDRKYFQEEIVPEEIKQGTPGASLHNHRHSYDMAENLDKRYRSLVNFIDCI